jgi:hypothetical protein
MRERKTKRHPAKRTGTRRIDIEEVREKITPILRRYGVSKAGVFGSLVRGEADKESDVDILVEITKSDVSLLDFVGLKLELEEALGKKVDLVEYSTIKPLLKEIILNEEVAVL